MLKTSSSSSRSPPRQQPTHPRPPQTTTPALLFSHLALLLQKLTSYLPPHEAQKLLDISTAFSQIEALHHEMAAEVEELRASNLQLQQQSKQMTSSSTMLNSGSMMMMGMGHTTNNNNNAATTTTNANPHNQTLLAATRSYHQNEVDEHTHKRLQAYRRAVQDRNEKIAQLRHEKEAALLQIQAVHQQHHQEEQEWRKQSEERNKQESAEVQQLTHLAMSMQKTISKLQEQVTGLTGENAELKQQLAHAHAQTQTYTHVQAQQVLNEGKKMEKTRQKAAAAAPMLPPPPSETEGEEEESDYFRTALNNQHPRERDSLPDYSSNDDVRSFDYRDVTHLDDDDDDDGEEGEEENGERLLRVGERERYDTPQAPIVGGGGGKRGRGGAGGAAASIASYFQISRSTKAASQPQLQPLQIKARAFNGTAAGAGAGAGVGAAGGGGKKKNKKKKKGGGGEGEVSSKQQQEGFLLGRVASQSRGSGSGGGGGRRGEANFLHLSLDELLCSLGLAEEGGVGATSSRR